MTLKEQKKSELLDSFVIHYKERIQRGDRVTIPIRILIKQYDEIDCEKRVFVDPLANNVFHGNCGEIIIRTALFILNSRIEINRKDLMLSQMPHISEMALVHSIGKKSLWIYEGVMKEYGFTDKLT